MVERTPSQPAPAGCATSFLLIGFVVVFTLALLTLPFALMGYGIYEAVLQDRLLRTAQPVAATVVSSRVRESRGRRGPSEVPIIIFRYDVAGRVYESDRSKVLFAHRSPQGVTAQQFVAAHPLGATVEAYYVPEEPWRAFLVKEYVDRPYVLIYAGLGLLALLLSSGIAYSFIPTQRTSADPGWHPLAVRRPLRNRVRVNLAQGVFYLCVWGWAAWHYFAHVPPPHGVMSYIVTGAISLPGLWYLVSSARARFTGRAVSDARVAVDARELRIGKEAQVRVEQDLLGDAVLEHVRVGLMCEKITGSGKHKSTETHWQAWTSPATPLRPPGLRGRRRGVSFVEKVSIPADVPATQSDGDPRYAWKLVVETALAGCPDYREEFEVHVRCADDAEDANDDGDR